jgi:hypothetical protein
MAVDLVQEHVQSSHSALVTSTRAFHAETERATSALQRFSLVIDLALISNLFQGNEVTSCIFPCSIA